MISKDRQSQALKAIPEDGITSNELSKRLCWAWETAQQACCDLVNAGQLFKAKMGHRTVRYFRAATAPARMTRTPPDERGYYNCKRNDFG